MGVVMSQLNIINSGNRLDFSHGLKRADLIQTEMLHVYTEFQIAGNTSIKNRSMVFTFAVHKSFYFF